MVSYKCDNCSKTFIKKIDYERHINRKFRCKYININNIQNNNLNEDIINITPNDLQSGPKMPQEPQNSPEMPQNARGVNNTGVNNTGVNNTGVNNKCKYCNKIFIKLYGLNRHLDNNRCKVKQMINEQKNNKDQMIELLIDKNNQFQKQINELTKIIHKLDSKISKKCISKSNNTISSNNTNSNNTINNIININAFGDVDDVILYLKPNDCKNIINKGKDAIIESIKTVHFNLDYLNYANVYVSDKKMSHALIYNGNKFVIEDIDEIVNTLFENHQDLVQRILDDTDITHKTDASKRVRELIAILDKYSEIKKNYPDAKCKEKEEIINKVKFILYNNREITEQCHKAIKKMNLERIGNVLSNDNKLIMNTVAKDL